MCHLLKCALNRCPDSPNLLVTTDIFWKVHTTCKLILMEDKPRETKGKPIKETDFGKLDDLIIRENIDSTLSMLTLLLRSSECGVLYGLRSNYRIAAYGNLMDSNGLKKSMFECAYEENKADSDFANSSLGITFYKIARTKKWGIDTPRLVSICKENIELADCEILSGEVEIAQASAVYPSDEDYRTLAYILNVKLRPNAEQCTNRSLCDFPALLKVHEGDPILNSTSNSALKNFVNKKLAWPFFEILPNAPPSFNFWRIRSFLQVLTDVGISILEGSHRMTLASKLMTAMDLNGSLPVIPNKLILQKELPHKSPLFDKVTVHVLTPADAHQTGQRRHPYITLEAVEACRKWSEKVADQKSHYIPPTWKEWMENTNRAIQNCDVKPLDFDDFIRIPVTTRANPDDKYLPVLVSVIRVVSQCLVDKLPAKKLADVATSCKDKTKKMDPIAFVRDNIAQTTTYAQNWWQAVRTE
jgi:hypothetical protein